MHPPLCPISPRCWPSYLHSPEQPLLERTAQQLRSLADAMPHLHELRAKVTYADASALPAAPASSGNTLHGAI